MRPLVYYGTPDKKKCKKAFACLSAGWRKLGVPYIRSLGQKYEQGHLSVFYGVTPFTLPPWQECQKRGGDYVYMDNDYFGRRDHWRLTLNATQHTGVGKPDFDRFRSLGIDIKPWIRKGTYVLLVCQSKWWHERHGEGVTRWSQRIESEIAAHTDRAVRIRRKPGEGELSTSLEYDLSRAWCVVTHSSAVAVRAILAGVPAFVTSPCAASAMAETDLSKIETPHRPDGRMEWAATLAANQFTREEIMTGKPWESVMS